MGLLANRGLKTCFVSEFFLNPLYFSPCSSTSKLFCSCQSWQWVTFIIIITHWSSAVTCRSLEAQELVIPVIISFLNWSLSNNKRVNRKWRRWLKNYDSRVKRMWNMSLRTQGMIMRKLGPIKEFIVRLLLNCRMEKMNLPWVFWMPWIENTRDENWGGQCGCGCRRTCTWHTETDDR